MDKKLSDLDCKLYSISIFRNVLCDNTLNYLWELISDEVYSRDRNDEVNDYSLFISNLYEKTVNLSEYVLKKVLEDENFYIVGKGMGKKFDPIIIKTVENELKILQELSQITTEDIRKDMIYDGFLPYWKTSEIDFISEYRKRIENIETYGYGIYSKYYMFIFKNGHISPVKHPDKQSLDDLYGYERERNSVINNTLALLDGKPAQNVLLYGDAGTGKSSTVKAIVNKYYSRGLRLIEITKEQLRDMPDIIGSISKNPLKFILFIDDLSFSSGDDCFGALKATLEGSASARADNIAIYATSNRRHLVKESFSDREGDDIHRNDTIQELISLSSRFGLKVNFSKPDKVSYLEIVMSLLRANEMEFDESAISVKAEAFAMRNGGRSARTAKQFVNQLIADNEI